MIGIILLKAQRQSIDQKQFFTIRLVDIRFFNCWRYMISDALVKLIKQKMIAPKDEQIEAVLGQRAFKVPNLICHNGRKIERFCYNEACKYDSLCCEEESCDCESQHHSCSFKKLRQLNKYVEDRLLLDSKILRGLFAIQNELMNKLMANRKLLIQQGKGWKIGQHQVVIDSIYFKNTSKGIKGKEMKKLFSQLQTKKAIFEFEADQYLSSYKAEGGQVISKLQNLRNNIVDNLSKDKLGMQKKKANIQKEEEAKNFKEQVKERQKILINSKILREDQQGSKKSSFLMKQLGNPSELQLLYRASQQQFSALKFHKCCDGFSNTVTIVRTEFGKTIAAYTPLKWGLVQGNIADDSKRSFLLQLELKEKMALVQPETAIFNYYNYGPIFGGGNDLLIHDRCNQNQYSYAYFPHSYNNNQKYQKDNQQSWTALCGSQNGWNFRVLEYEVFLVTY